AIIGVSILQSQRPVVHQRILGARADVPAVARTAGVEGERDVAVADKTARDIQSGSGPAAGDVPKGPLHREAEAQPDAALCAGSVSRVEVVGGQRRESENFAATIPVRQPKDVTLH